MCVSSREREKMDNGRSRRSISFNFLLFFLLRCLCCVHIKLSKVESKKKSLFFFESIVALRMPSMDYWFSQSTFNANFSPLADAECSKNPFFSRYSLIPRKFSTTSHLALFSTSRFSALACVGHSSFSSPSSSTSYICSTIAFAAIRRWRASEGWVGKKMLLMMRGRCEANEKRNFFVEGERCVAVTCDVFHFFFKKIYAFSNPFFLFFFFFKAI